MSIDPESKREIIIVRRSKHDEHDEHHGGVWKIAYADFMTAMMAFFLVMWLINAANEETKAAVASYFNPVKLMDRHSSARGIEDIGDSEGRVRYESDVIVKDGTRVLKNSFVERPTEAEERQMFREPYAMLAEIAHETGVMQNSSEKGDGGAALSGSMTGAESGQAYRDPFSPHYWSSKAADDQIPIAPAPAPAMNSLADGATVVQKDKQIKDKQIDAALTPKSKNDDVKRVEEKLADEIRAVTGVSANQSSPDVSIVPMEGGIMIQLTDKVDYGMFAIGSAKPDGRVVQILEKIAGVLATRQGDVIISGHTDARPFKNASYDNWRLSAARAQMAYYMLVRGGLNEKRVMRVEGYADRQPKRSDDPNAAENRRIDIFLKTTP